jgi:hypothetical protein
VQASRSALGKHVRERRQGIGRWSVNVGDLDATVTDLRAKGITFIDLDFPDFRTEDGIARTPEGPAAWFSDPDGNIISITQAPVPS